MIRKYDTILVRRNLVVQKEVTSCCQMFVYIMASVVLKVTVQIVNSHTQQIMQDESTTVLLQEVTVLQIQICKYINGL